MCLHIYIGLADTCWLYQLIPLTRADSINKCHAA